MDESSNNNRIAAAAAGRRFLFFIVLNHKTRMYMCYTQTTLNEYIIMCLTRQKYQDKIRIKATLIPKDSHPEAILYICALRLMIKKQKHNNRKKEQEEVCAVTCIIHMFFFFFSFIFHYFVFFVSSSYRMQQSFHFSFSCISFYWETPKRKKSSAGQNRTTTVVSISPSLLRGISTLYTAGLRD